MIKLTKSEAGKLGALKSLAITQKLKQARINEYNLNPTICGACHTSMPYEKRSLKFCSHSCSAKLSNIRRRKKPAKCLNCNSTLKSYKGKYCNTQCQKDHEWTLIKKQYLIDPMTKINHKRYLLELKGHICWTCDNSTWLGQPIPLELEHINGHSLDNHPNNLSLLCPNCHAQTPTYKSKNRGNGRFSRRERYKAGKSF